MRNPTRAVAGNLRWTRSGTVWADYLLSPLPYGLRPDKDKIVVQGLHRAMIRVLPAESLLLGIAVGLDPVSVVSRMIGDVDLGLHPDWAAECSATLDSLAEISPMERVYWLSIRLPADGLSVVAGPANAALASVGEALGLPPTVIGQDEIVARHRQAEQISRLIPFPFDARPATAAQMVWLHIHAAQRGLTIDIDLPRGGGDAALLPRSRAPFTSVLLDEGAKTDVGAAAELQGTGSDRQDGQERGEEEALSPWRQFRNAVNVGTQRRRAKDRNLLHPAWSRRVVKVVQPHIAHPVASYQVLSTIASAPAEGMVFPGSEFLGRIDECGVDVDWAVRLATRSNVKAQSANRKALKALNEQFEHRSEEVNLSGRNVLDMALSDLTDYSVKLSSDTKEIEAQPTFIFAVAGPTREVAALKAEQLHAWFASTNFVLATPLGQQRQLWWAMTPGAPTNPAVREWAQIMTSDELAAAVPMITTALGDRSGSLLGLNITTGLPGVVMSDPDGDYGRDGSSSLGITGNLGAGKTATMKKLVGDVLDRGGLLITPDRSARGEWAEWATSVTAARVVDCERPQLSLDPLRLFADDLETGADVAQSFLTALLGLSPVSDRGATMSEALEAGYLRSHGIDSLGALRDHLASPECVLPEAGEIARVMNVFARRPRGRVVFDSTIPPLHVDDVSAVVIRTHGLQLPTGDEIGLEHLWRQVGPEKILGRAIYALIAALARRICFRDQTRLGVFAVAETHHVTASPEGERELIDFLRDGRKHRAAVYLDSHDPEADFGSVTLRGLIPNRLVMRQVDTTLAERSLRWLGLEPTEELLDMLTKHTSPQTENGVAPERRGEGFYRDAMGNIGRIKVLLPAVPARAQAVQTRPGDDGTADALSVTGRPRRPGLDLSKGDADG